MSSEHDNGNTPNTPTDPSKTSGLSPPDRAATTRFLAALTGRENPVVTFQTFPDDKKTDTGFRPAILHGTLEQHFDDLVARNKAGHGVFVMVNEGDLQGREEANVVAVRAVFIDDDGDGPAPVKFTAEGSAPFDGPAPTMTVRTKRGEHNYWCLRPGVAKENFTAAQESLASHFGTDATVKDLPRVMRLPGFLHMKDRKAPFLVELVQVNQEVHDLGEVLAAYPARFATQPVVTPRLTTTTANPQPTAGVSIPTEDTEEARGAAREYVASFGPAIAGEGGDKHTFKLCAALTRGFNLSEEAVMDLLAEWNAGCQPPWSTTDLLRKVRDARAKGREEIGGRLKTSGAGTGGDISGFIIEHCVPLLNSHFALLRTADGTERVFAVSDTNEATLLQSAIPLKQALHDDLKVRLHSPPGDGLLDRAIALWKRECPRLQDEPEAFCFSDDDRLCFKRFDWKPSPGRYPAWEEFLDRLSDRDAFMAYLWSCFDKTNDSRQLLWLRGDGKDGKSKVLGLLFDLFGNAGAAINNSHITKGSQFFFSLLYGKRVVFYPDCKNPRFAMTEVVRNLTSGDAVPVEFKNQPLFTARLRLKLMVGSNPKPEITSETADQSRLIYIEVGPSKNTDDPTWSKRLKAELPGFLHACRETYVRVCPRGGDILLNDQSRELLCAVSAGFEERFAEIFESNFEVVPGQATKASIVSGILRSNGLTNNEVGDFKAWAARTHGVRYEAKRDRRVYINLRVRSQQGDLANLLRARATVEAPTPAIKETRALDAYCTSGSSPPNTGMAS